LLVTTLGSGNTPKVLRYLYRNGIQASLSSDVDDLMNCRSLFISGVSSLSSDAAISHQNIISYRYHHHLPTYAVCAGFQLVFRSSPESFYHHFPYSLLSQSLSHIFASQKVHIGTRDLYLYDHNGPKRKCVGAGYFCHSFGYVASFDDLLKLKADSFLYCDWHNDLKLLCGLRIGSFIGFQFHPEVSPSFSFNTFISL
jgi:imidazoleglycerol phosphate synthase glutamine amidotransferase subunit HisH